MTRDELLAVMPLAKSRIDTWLAPLNAAMERFQINTPLRQAAFLAQIAHESANLSRVRENLNYKAEVLPVIFNTGHITRFTKTDAYRYGRTDDHPADQEMIANIAYAGRFGNGPMESGDGWRYRGGGPGQLTFKNNYARCGAALGIDLVGHPELIERPDIGALAFGWFWAEGNSSGKDLNLLADTGNIDAISRRVNGGDHGLVARAQLFETMKARLA